MRYFSGAATAWLRNQEWWQAGPGVCPSPCPSCCSIVCGLVTREYWMGSRCLPVQKMRGCIQAAPGWRKWIEAKERATPGSEGPRMVAKWSLAGLWAGWQLRKSLCLRELEMTESRTTKLFISFWNTSTNIWSDRLKLKFKIMQPNFSLNYLAETEETFDENIGLYAQRLSHFFFFFEYHYVSNCSQWWASRDEKQSLCSRVHRICHKP